MKKNVSALMNANNFSELTNVCKGAKNEVNSAKKNLFFFINTLNKLARKNEFVDGVNLKELGKKVRDYAINLGHEVSVNAPFNAYLFTNSYGVTCYKVVRKVKSSGAFAISETITDYKRVKLSENGLINAYKYILGIDAKELDKTARAHNKEVNKTNRKAENAAKHDAKKALKKLQENARERYAKGEICIAEFAEIMARVA